MEVDLTNTNYEFAFVMQADNMLLNLATKVFTDNTQIHRCLIIEDNKMYSHKMSTPELTIKQHLIIYYVTST